MDSFFNDEIIQNNVEEIPMGDASVPTPEMPVDEDPNIAPVEPAPIEETVPTNENCATGNDSDVSEIMNMLTSLGNKLSSMGLIKNFTMNYELGDNTLVDTDEAVPAEEPVAPTDVFAGEEPAPIDAPVEEPIADQQPIDPLADADVGEPIVPTDAPVEEAPIETPAEPIAEEPVAEEPIQPVNNVEDLKANLENAIDQAKDAVASSDAEPKEKEKAIDILDKIEDKTEEKLEKLTDILDKAGDIEEDADKKEDEGNDEEAPADEDGTYEIKDASDDDLESIHIYCQIYDIPEPTVEDGTVKFTGLTPEQKEIIISKIAQ